MANPFNSPKDKLLAYRFWCTLHHVVLIRGSDKTGLNC
jgi:hypothetical protein